MKKKSTATFSRKRELLMATLFVLLLMALGVIVAVGDGALRPKPAPATGTEMTVRGKLVCVPLRDVSDSKVHDCLVGIQTDTNKYYALNTRAQMTNDEGTVSVTGIMLPAGDGEAYINAYDVVGTIVSK